jgi:hypothetical protein
LKNSLKKINFTLRYIDSPNWGVFSNSEELQQNIEEKISKDMLNTLSNLSISYENLVKTFLNKTKEKRNQTDAEKNSKL